MMPPVAAEVPSTQNTVVGQRKQQSNGGSTATDATAADQLIGRSQPNQMYLGNRLLYGGPESFDPLTWPFVKEMIFQAVIVGFASFVLGLVPFFLSIIGAATGSKALEIFGGLGLLIAYPGLWLYFLFHRIPVATSEWKLLVDDEAGSADQVFSHITWALKRRQTPIPKLKVRRLSQPRRPKRDYLELRDGIFTGLVSAFPYGADLYIGWTMWWRLSPFRWLIVFLGRLYLTLTGRGSQIHVIHRYEQAKAMREAMHSAAREGVDAASGVVAYEGAGTIGSDIEVEVVASLDDVPGFVASATE
jgi:hypothetical protein